MADDPREQAIAARLTAKQIAEQFLGEKSYDSQQEILHAFTVSALTHAIERAMSAHVETLTQQVAELRDETRNNFNNAMRNLDRAERAEQENARLTADLIVAKESMRMMVENVKSLQLYGKQAEQQRDAAHAALTRYGQHLPLCRSLNRPNTPSLTCTCGLDAALAASAPQKAGYLDGCQCGHVRGVHSPQIERAAQVADLVGHCTRCDCGAFTPAPAQETERNQ